MKSQRIKTYLYGFLLASALLATGCQQDEITEEIALPPTPDGDTPANAGSVILHFNVASELSTRTTLPGSGNTQHVKSVQLYIFDGTDANSPCVASEDIGWSAYFGNHLPTNTATMKYTVQYQGLTTGKAYTFLAVGLDDTSGSTYGYPAAIQAGSTVLSAAIATLSGIEATTWTAMSRSELFAGATALTPTAQGTRGNVDLWRRVAGVMGWFTHVPTQIGLNTVSAIQITLYTQQNKSVPLIQRSQTPVFKDYINSPLAPSTGGQVLVSIPVPAGTLPATVLSKGSYVLPVPAPVPVNANDYTLKVELVNALGNVVYTKRVTLSGSDSDSSTGGGTGVIDPEGVYRFPIVANRFYGIGSQTSPVSLGGNTTKSNAITARIISLGEAMSGGNE